MGILCNLTSGSFGRSLLESRLNNDFSTYVLGMIVLFTILWSSTCFWNVNIQSQCKLTAAMLEIAFTFRGQCFHNNFMYFIFQNAMNVAFLWSFINTWLLSLTLSLIAKNIDWIMISAAYSIASKIFSRTACNQGV